MKKIYKLSYAYLLFKGETPQNKSFFLPLEILRNNYYMQSKVCIRKKMVNFALKNEPTIP